MLLSTLSGAPFLLPRHMNNSTNKKMYMEESSSSSTTRRNGVDSLSILTLRDTFTTEDTTTSRIRFDGGGGASRTPTSIFAVSRVALASPPAGGVATAAAPTLPLHRSEGSHKYVKELGAHDGNFP